MKDQRQLPLGGKQEPALGRVLEAKGGSGEAHQRQASQVEALCAEVFRLTGQKITQDDPIILAALFQSELINKSGANAASQMQEAVSQAVAQLADAVKAERKQATEVQKMVASTFQQIANGTKQVAEQELAAMQARFARMASDTLEQVRREATHKAPGISLWWRAGACTLAGITAGLIGGMMISGNSGRELSENQIRLMHNGLLLDKAWPKLSKSARETFELSPMEKEAVAPAKDDKARGK